MGFVAALWGSEPLMWGSEVSFAINGVCRSEMWGSPSLPHNIVIVVYDEQKLLDQYGTIQRRSWGREWAYQQVKT